MVICLAMDFQFSMIMGLKSDSSPTSNNSTNKKSNRFVDGSLEGSDLSKKKYHIKAKILRRRDD